MIGLFKSICLSIISFIVSRVILEVIRLFKNIPFYYLKKKNFIEDLSYVKVVRENKKLTDDSFQNGQVKNGKR